MDVSASAAGTTTTRRGSPASTSLEASYDMVIVGAGISGCVFAERGSRELGLKSLIIDKRDHIGGNCYDFVNKAGSACRSTACTVPHETRRGCGSTSIDSASGRRTSTA